MTYYIVAIAPIGVNISRITPLEKHKYTASLALN